MAPDNTNKPVFSVIRGGLSEKASESLKSEDKAYFSEQLGIGLLGGHNY